MTPRTRMMGACAGRFCGSALGAAFAVVACGGATSATGATASDGGADVVSAGDASAGATSCEALVLAFVGCDDERRSECAREYAAVSAANRALVDASVACLRMNRASVAAASWPPPSATCTPAAVPPLLLANDLWFHGVCQGDNGSVATQVPADPNFPPCGGDAGAPACFFGDANTGATL